MLIFLIGKYDFELISVFDDIKNSKVCILQAQLISFHAGYFPVTEDGVERSIKVVALLLLAIQLLNYLQASSQVGIN